MCDCCTFERLTGETVVGKKLGKGTRICFGEGIEEGE